jgi:hypothetical protein
LGTKFNYISGPSPNCENVVDVIPEDTKEKLEDLLGVPIHYLN